MGVRKNDLTGQKFGKLTVLEAVPRGKGEHQKYKCECECGEITFTESKRLTGKYKTRSCKYCGYKTMAEKRTLSNNLSMKNRSYRIYKKNAISRGYNFNISFEEFEDLITTDCHYCKSAAIKAYTRLNGVDRKDNSKGYLLSNCVSCCSICNRMKSALSHEEFLNHIANIYKNFNN